MIRDALRWWAGFLGGGCLLGAAILALSRPTDSDGMVALLGIGATCAVCWLRLMR